MTLFAEYGQLVFQKLQVNFPLPHHFLLHNLERKFRARVDVNTFSDFAESTTAQKATHSVLFTDVVNPLKLLVIHHAQHPLLRQLLRCRLAGAWLSRALRFWFLARYFLLLFLLIIFTEDILQSIISAFSHLV